MNHEMLKYTGNVISNLKVPLLENYERWLVPSNTN